MLRQLSVLLVCIVAVTAVEVNSMSLLKGEKVCVASAFEGRLTFEGKPASGARIVRKFSWKDQKGETEETIADKDGRFSFPSHWDVLRGVLPVQFVSVQDILVHYGGQEYKIWLMGKLSTNEYSEFGGRPENFRCELTDEIRRVDLEHEYVGTNCYWERAE
jgi:hypothetical protein